MAFHGDPATAYNQRSNIWKSDTQYAKVFNDETTAEHIIFSYSLLKAAENAKSTLRDISEEERTDTQNRQWGVLSQRGVTFLVSSAAASGLETILDKPIPNRFHLKYKSTRTVGSAIDSWSSILEVIMPLINKLAPALVSKNLKNKEVVKPCVDDFVYLLQAVRQPNAATFDKFSELL